MKLNIKKSKIIVPALGLLLLSTAASVSGSVAWFTANRTFSTQIGQFGVTKLDGDLACTLGAGTGTSLTASSATYKDDHNNIIEVKDSGTANLLGDSSFDHTSGHLYTDDPDVTNESGVNTTAFLDLDTAGSTWKVSNNVYYAVTWTMTFHYTYGASLNNVGLFFNSGSSTATGATSKQSDAAFRIAFVSTDSIVWAPNQAKLNPIQQYVSGTGAMTAYTDANLICSDANITKNADGVASASDREYLGTFTATSAGATIDLLVTCTAWYDGTYLDNSKTLGSLSASLSFYTRTLATA